MLMPPMEGLFNEFKGDKSMALETLKGVEKIGGFEVGHAEKAWEDEDGNSGMEDIASRVRVKYKGEDIK